MKEDGNGFLHDGARAMLKDAGAEVDPASRRVRFEPALVQAHGPRAGGVFRLHARDPRVIFQSAVGTSLLAPWRAPRIGLIGREAAAWQ